MAGLRKVNHKGTEIIYIDYRGAKEAEMIQIISEAEAMIIKEQKRFRTLTNINDAFATKGYLTRAKDMASKTQHLSDKGAIIGITGGKLVLLKIFNKLFAGGRGLKPFDNELEALDFLAS